MFSFVIHQQLFSLQEMNFCYDGGSGIYMFPKIICSRQAYVCKNQNEGFAITCLPGMIMLGRPFGCFVYPPSCASDKISMKQSAPLRQHAIEMYCDQQQLTKQNNRVMMLPKMQCINWYVGCGKLIKDIIYCENGFIYDVKLRKCRQRNNKDHCIMPDLCKNRKWRTVSLGDCKRQFVYCRDQVPEKFVCSEGFIFFNDRCVPMYQASSECWKCQNGQKRHTSLHSCNEYSVCQNGHWEDHTCPTGMIYFEANQMCQTDPSCAHPFKCKMGTSFQLKCNEYLICSSNGIVEHRFCPPFHRWDNRALLCIPDNNCLSSSNKSCREGAVIDSFDCKFYYQCSGGKWHKMSCVAYPAAELCKVCRHHSDNVAWQAEERCNESDTVANPQDCRNYAICKGRRWESMWCEVGTFWNQNLKRCYHITDCKAFKRVECNHGQHLIGDVCNEYLKCLQGSWITMKCLPGYAFDVITKKCVISNECLSSNNNNYLSVIDNDITDPPISLFQIETKLEENQQQLHRPCQFGSTIRNEYDCNRYFECTMDEYKDRYCNDNHEFNDESGKCEKEYHCDLSRCRNGRIIESEICGHYQICINGTWHKEVCENNRQFIDGYCQTVHCNNDNNAILSALSSSCKEGSVLADNINCKRYFICRQGRFQQQFCWNGATFDKKRGYCVRNTICMSEGSCIEDTVQADKQDRTAYRICSDGKFESHSCPYGLVYIPSKRRCERDSVIDGVKYETCKESGGPTGYRADPNDCHKFYQCAHGKWVSKACPDKLYWNMEKTTCDWLPDDDSCKNRITHVLL
uniref:Chitin binding Peritrophin-A domain-containing protein n=2 Tax=Wuchereria bancrofti TaxID=6293 RepID=A0AAF5PZY7_WUCBA